MMNVPTVATLDWVHCSVGNGALAAELNEYMNTCDPSSLASLETFVSA